MPVKLNSSGGGSVTLDVPSITTTNTLILPARTGNIITSADSNTVTQSMIASGVVGAGPAFSAYNSIATSLTSGAYTKLQNSNVEYDTTNNYDASTNYRYTPNVAGYYLVTGAMAIAGTSGVSVVHVYKNGTIFKSGAQVTNTSDYVHVTVSAFVYLNGTTDYIELYGFQNSGGPLSVYNAGQPNFGYFQACLLRAA